MKKSYTLFTGLVLLAASLVFTGCQNFLSGNNLKKELEEKIQYEKKDSLYNFCGIRKSRIWTVQFKYF